MRVDVVQKKATGGVPAVNLEVSFEESARAFVKSLNPNNNFVEIVLTSNSTYERFATGVSADGENIILDRFHSVPLTLIKSISGHGFSISREAFIPLENPLSVATVPKRGTY